MVLADCLDQRAFEVVGTDISTRVLTRARTGHYPMERARNVPPAYLRQFCLRGQGAQEGTLLVDKQLRRHVRFEHANLNSELPKLGQFDVIFLRNVLIYFDTATKKAILNKMRLTLKPQGYLFLGGAETTLYLDSDFDQVYFDKAACYRPKHAAEKSNAKIIA